LSWTTWRLSTTSGQASVVVESKSRARCGRAVSPTYFDPATRPLPAVARLAEIPGMGDAGAQAVLAEIGLDMSRFPTAGHLRAGGAGGDPAVRELDRVRVVDRRHDVSVAGQVFGQAGQGTALCGVAG
jgi:transposase